MSEINATELEEQINAKFGMIKNFELDERFHLVRELGTHEIVVLDLDSPGDGHHKLRDASQTELERIADYFDMSPEDDDASHIPD